MGHATRGDEPVCTVCRDVAMSAQPATDTPVQRAGVPGPTLESVYESELNYVWRLLKRLGIRMADLEDVVHDVFLVVHSHLHQYDAIRPLRPWVTAIVYRVAANHRRRAVYRRETEMADETRLPDLSQPQALDMMMAREAQQVVLQALSALDEGKRAVFVLHEMEGHTMPEVAEMTQLSVNTCYSRLRLAREAFAKAVRRVVARGRKP